MAIKCPYILCDILRLWLKLFLQVNKNIFVLLTLFYKCFVNMQLFLKKDNF